MRWRRDERDRRIVALAVPALGALAVEPGYVLVDTAIIGRLGTTPLAGLALATTLLVTVVAACNFLAYGTTPRVAGLLAAGRRAAAAEVGVQALWLCTLLGVPLAVLLGLVARPAVSLLGGEGDVLEAAVTYLRISAVGVPFTLVALVTQGVLRGHQDLRTPLVIAIAANGSNVVLELVAVYGLDLGVAGSAWSTVIAQVAGAVAYLAALRPKLRPARARRPDPSAMAPLLVTGGHLVLRVASLLAVLTAATAVAARIDEATLAAHQIGAQVLSFVSLVLDALAIPAQALVAEGLGAGRTGMAIDTARRVQRLSAIAGVALAVVMLALAPVLPQLFTADGAVASRATAALVVLAVLLVPAAIAMGLDGVLIGAGDERFLASAMAISLLAFVPLAGLTLARPHLGIVGVWAGVAAWMVARAVLNHRRVGIAPWSVTPAR